VNIAAVGVSLAAFMLGVFPPDWAGRASWLSLGLVFVAGLWQSPNQAENQRRPYRIILGMAFLGLPILATLFGNLTALGTLPYALVALAYFCVAENHLASRDGKRAWMTALCLCIWIQALFVSTQWRLSIPGTAVNTALWLRLLQGRVWGSFLTSNILAAWLVLTLPPIAGHILDQAAWRRQIFPALSLAAGAVLLWLTRSGGALFSLAAAFAVFLLFTRRKKLPGFLFLVMALTAGLLGLVLWSRGFTFGNARSGQDIIFSRLEIWRPAWHAWMEAPFLGQPGQAVSAYARAQEKYHGFGAYPHQAALSLALNWGLFGLLTAMASFGLIWARFRRRLETGVSGTELGASIGLLAALFHSQVEMSFQQPVIFLSCLISLGALLGEPGPRISGLKLQRPGFGALKLKHLWPGSLIFFAVLCYHGGLMDWQWALAAYFFISVFFYAAFSGCLEGPPGRFDSLDALSLGALLSAGLSLIFSVNPWLSLSQWSGLACLWIFWTLLRRQTSPSAPRALAAIQLIVLALCLAVLSNAVWLGLSSPVEEGRIWILSLPHHAIRFLFPNQNLFAAGLVAPALCVSAVQFWKGENKTRAFLLTSFFFLFLVYTGSRGALFAAVGGGAWIFLRSGLRLKQVKFGKLLLGAVAVAGIALYAPFSGLAERHRQQNNSVEADPYYSMRTEFWKKTVVLALQRPWTGWGLGTLSEDFHRLDIPTPRLNRFPLARYRLNPEHAHNEWLELCAESGILSALLFAGLVALLLWRWFFSEASAWNLSLEAALVALFSHSLVDFTFHCPTLLFGTALLLALRETVSADGREAVMPAFKLLAFLLAAVFLSQALGHYTARQAQKNPGASAYEAALALAPLNVDVKTQYADVLSDLAADDPPRASQALLQLLGALKIAPENAMAHLRYALTLKKISVGVFDAAQLERMGDLLPGWERISFEHPQAGSREKFFRLYKEASQEALSLRPYDARWRLLLAQSALDEQDPALLRQRLEEAIALEPNYAAAWALKGQLARARGDWSGYKEALLELKRIEPLGFESDDPYSVQLRLVDWNWAHAELKKLVP
jgi:O-antigen ligase